MIIKLMGLLDVFSALTILGHKLGFISNTIAIYVLVYLSLKFIAFRKDIASIGDFITSLFLLAMILGYNPALPWTLLFTFYVLQKGIMSLK